MRIHGKGWKRRCTHCKGRGYFEHYDQFGWVSKKITCKVCGGSGVLKREAGA